MMNDSTAHALVLSNPGTDLTVTVEDRTNWFGVIDLPNDDAVQVSQDHPSMTFLEVWTGAGTARIGLREYDVRALIDLLQAAVD